MRMNLNELEIRVLGCLMEKELTTPEYYPLTVNALLSACNQKSNRDPVLTLTEADLLGALRSLGGRGLARLTTTGGRVGKYCHSVADNLGLDAAARSLLAELMLRGPQTVGELRNRCERMHAFACLEAVEEVLGRLRQYGPPLVGRMPRQAGRKEQRYGQFFAGLPETPEELDEPVSEGEGRVEPTAERALLAKPAVERQTVGQPRTDDRLSALEAGVGDARVEICTMRREVEELLSLFA